MQTAARFAGRALAVVVITVAGAALVLGVIVPRAAGATPYVVLTDSMAPSLPAGTLVVSRSVEPEQIRIGSVITYQLRSGEEQLVTHRVVGIGMTVGGERTYVTQGDSNDVPDAQPVRDVQVRGALWYRVPFLGHVAGVFTGQRAMVGVAAGVLLLGYAGWQVTRAAQDRAARKRSVPDRSGTAEAGSTEAVPMAVGPMAVGPTAAGSAEAGPTEKGGGR